MITWTMRVISKNCTTYVVRSMQEFSLLLGVSIEKAFRGIVAQRQSSSHTVTHACPEAIQHLDEKLHYF